MADSSPPPAPAPATATKRCHCCGTDAALDATSCPRCGEASWLIVEPAVADEPADAATPLRSARSKKA